MPIFYKDDNHREALRQLISKYSKSYNGHVDKEYLAALYIICVDSELRSRGNGSVAGFWGKVDDIC